MKKCLGCMQEYEETYQVCPHCGFVEGQEADSPLHMNPGCILKGENSTYIVGKVIGSGSFGVTYVAWDKILERKVAIKEYLPSEYATRAAGQNSIAIFGDKNEQFCNGMEKFIDEARRLAKFENEEGIVSIFDHFYENDTAYIVMEYLDGITLSEYLEQNGKIEPQMAVNMLMPVMRSLINVHKTGIIHRDIAPDNIMITKEGRIKLIDFGAARFASSAHSKSLSVIVKQGYSPEEQYRGKGNQGPHTDVYSLSATMYKMITGITPPDALERRAKLENEKKNILIPFRKKSIKISRVIENALYNAMNIKMEDRTQNVEKFIEELHANKPAKLRDQSIPLIDRLNWKKWQIASVGTASVSVITLIALLLTGVIHFSNPFVKTIHIPEGMTRVPSIVNQKLSDAEKSIKNNLLLYTIVGKEYSSVIPKDYILTQNINPGSLTEINTMLMIKISGGTERAEVPNVIGIERKEAEKILEEAHFKADIENAYSNYIADGYVISQEYEQGEQLDKDSTIKITVSKGRDPNVEIAEKKVIIPNFVGMKYQEVIMLAAEKEISIIVSMHSYSDKFQKDIVMNQSIKAGMEISNLEPVALDISLGIKYSTVPDVMYFTEEEAISKLKSMDLNFEKLYEESEMVGAGLVMAQSMREGEKVVSNTIITITISNGRGGFVMPDVVGKSQANAEKELRNKGLAVAVSYSFSNTFASGNVISQSIAHGTQVSVGTQVSIVVSSGEELFSVPNVVGKSQIDAVKELQNNRFKVQTIEHYSDTVAKGKVIAQSHAVGTQYKKNTEITITVSKGKEPFVISFDANGGSGTVADRTIYYGEAYGTLPTVLRTCYSFAGWYTSKTGGTKVEPYTVVNTKSSHTLYAHWIANEWTDWNDTNPNVDTSKHIIETRIMYRYRNMEYTSSSTSSLSGWTKYEEEADQKWTDMGWTTTKPTEVDTLKITDTKTVIDKASYTDYHYWGYYCSTDRYYNFCKYGNGYHTGHNYQYIETWSTTSYSMDSYINNGNPVYHLNSCKCGANSSYTKSYRIGGKLYFYKETVNHPAVTHTEWRYSTCGYIYYYKRWGNWSGWQTSAVTANNNRDVEQKTQYRYVKK